jgi:hypothetical protein
MLADIGADRLGAVVARDLDRPHRRLPRVALRHAQGTTFA